MSVAEWVKGLARQWGTEVRRLEREIDGLQGTMGRIHEEGPVAASIRSYNDSLPYREFSRDVSIFHRAWIDLKPELKAVIWLDFKEGGAPKRKVSRSGLSKSAYYRKRTQALELISRDFHLYQ